MQSFSCCPTLRQFRVKRLLQNRTLSIAIAASLLAHAALLAVRFSAPDAFRFKPTDPGLEVILVNAKHDKTPVKADALAQANLDGGGDRDKGRAKSPLPDLRKTEDGDSVQTAKRRIAELEAQQQKMMTRVASMSSIAAEPPPQKARLGEQPQLDGRDDVENAKAIARREAEIAKNIEDYNKRPKKTQITPNTRQVEYALYYKTLQTKIEKMGTYDFPRHKGKKLYGEMVIYIPIFHDGSIYEKEGGPRIERSSGNVLLDRAALRIVRRSAPFGGFPANMRSSGKDDVWEVITRFKFTREQALQTELKGATG